MFAGDISKIGHQLNQLHKVCWLLMLQKHIAINVSETSRWFDFQGESNIGASKCLSGY